MLRFPGDRKWFRPSAAVDPTRPNIAHDFLLGGKDNFATDRQFAEELLSQQPHLVRNARANRAFMQRVVRLIASSGVTQFIDLGTGLPTGENVHQVAQSAEPGARVVYVDNDPSATQDLTSPVTAS